MSGPVMPHRAPARGLAGSLRVFSERVPLRLKLVVILSLLVAVALVLTGLAAVTALRGNLVQRIDDQLVSAGRAMTRSAPGPYDDDRPGDRPGGPRRRPPPNPLYWAMVDASGQIQQVSGSFTGQLPKLSTPLTSQWVADHDGRPFTVSSAGDGPQWRVVVFMLPTPTTMDGYMAVAVAVGQSMGDVQKTETQFASLELLIGVVVLLLLGFFGYLAIRSSLRPLREVERTAAAIARGDLSRRVPDRDQRTEVGRLSAALNGMLGQIESAFRVRQASEAAARESEDRMRRFVSDASHELRTPLTSIRGFSELYRQGAANRPEDIVRLMRRIEDESARMGLLVDDLLLLAHLDQQRPLAREPVDLLTLASDAVHDAQAVDPSRPISLALLSGTQAPMVVGDDSRLRQVLGNLVGNALSHTAAGTPVAVRVGTGTAANGHAWAVLEVADAGPGLTAADAERIFERFYRAEASRSRTFGGAGLGLSIVSAIVTAHGGSVELDTAPGAGATFRVRLPLADALAAPDGEFDAEDADDPHGKVTGSDQPAPSPVSYN